MKKEKKEKKIERNKKKKNKIVSVNAMIIDSIKKISNCLKRNLDNCLFIEFFLLHSLHVAPPPLQ